MHRVDHELLLVKSFSLQLRIHFLLALFYRYFGRFVSECHHSHLAGDLQCVDLLGAGRLNEDVVKRYHELGRGAAKHLLQVIDRDEHFSQRELLA